MPLRRPLTGHVVSHTHWDRAWYWTFEETRTRLVDLMDGLLGLMACEPRYRHFVLDGQVAMLEDYLEVRPERSATVRDLVQAGRLLVGPFHVLPDLFIPSGESLVRNLTEGHRVAQIFGPIMKLGYLPDSFGHPAQLPQILAGFGIPGMVFARGMGDEAERLGADFFFEAPDGSRVLATHQIGGGYCNFARVGEGEGTAEDAVSRAAATVGHLARDMSPACPHGQLLLNNGCDHLPPQPELPPLLRAVNRRIQGIRLRHSTPVAYQAAVRRATSHGHFRPATHRGELRGSRYANLLSGTLSARVDLKLSHHETETELLRWAEPWLALSRALGCGRDDEALLRHAWRLLLLCQPHDDICGCSIDPVHDDDLNRMARARQVAACVAERALSVVAAQVADAGGAGPRFIVFNPHPWPVRQPVELEGHRGPLCAGETLLPRQRTRAGTLAQVEVPALGCVALGVGRVEGRARPPAPDGVALLSPGPQEVVLDNGRIRARLSRRGDLALAPAGTSVPEVEVMLLDEGDAGDTYDYSPPRSDTVVRGLSGRTRLVALERGPLRAAAELRGAMRLPPGLTDDRRARSPRRRPVPVELRAELHAGSPRLDLRLTVDNRVDDHRLRLGMYLPFRCAEVLAGAPFQVVRRPVRVPKRRTWQQQPAPTQPFTGFVAAEAARGPGGVGQLGPGLHEYEARPSGDGTLVLLTLLRSVRWLSRDDLSTRQGHAGPAFPLEGARMLGLTTFRVAVVLYQGTWLEAGVARQAEEHAAPPRVCRHASAGGALPPRLSLLSLDPASVLLSSLAPGPGGSLVARLVNLEERPVVARLGGAFALAERLRLDGTPLAGRVDPARILLRAGEILTLRLRR